jgi:transcriptional antiterminator Rof (Rho-off)
MPKGRPKNVKKPDPVKGLKVLADPRQRQAAMILAYNGYRKNNGRRTGALTHAAREAEVDPTTVYRWLDEPAFVAAIEEVTAQLIAECFEGYRVAIQKGDGRAIEALLAQLDSDLDRQLQRQKLAQEHEKEMLQLKIDKGIDPLTDQRLPDVVFRETGPNEQIDAGPDGEGH